MKEQTPPAEIQWLINTLGNCISTNSNFPSSRQSCRELLSIFQGSELAKFALAADLFFVIRQAVGADSSKTSIRLKYCAPLLRLLAAALAPLRSSYKDFTLGPDEHVIGAVHHWIADSDIFGSSNADTRFLAQDLCAHYAQALDFAELFTRYKGLVLQLYKSIAETGGATDLEKGKSLEMEQRLNKVMAKGFYRQIAANITSLDVTLNGNIKDVLKITRVETHLQIQTRIQTVFESRVSGIESIPCETTTLPIASQAVVTAPWLLKIDTPVVFDPLEFLYVAPASRKKSGCDRCSEKGFLTCRNCSGNKLVDCTFCNEGLVSCSVCNGSGKESFAENQQKINMCENCEGQGCDICKGTGYLNENIPRNRLKPCSKCTATGWVSCPRCAGRLLVPCPTCNSRGTVTCEKCAGKKHLEHHQVVTVTLSPKSKEFALKGPDIPNGLLLNPTDPHFTTIACLKGKTLSRQQPGQLFQRSIPDNFFTPIIEILDLECRSPSSDFKLHIQELVCKIAQYFLIEYEYKGFTAKAWWHPKRNKITGAPIVPMLIPATIQAALEGWRKRKYSKAVDTLLYAEKLATIHQCEAVYQKHYKRLPTMLRFAKWVRKQFAVPDNG